MDAGEVDQRGGGEKGVALAGGDGHAGEDNDGGGAGGEDRNGQEDAAMTPVEAVAQAHAAVLRCAY